MKGCLSGLCCEESIWKCGCVKSLVSICMLVIFVVGVYCGVLSWCRIER